MKIWLDADACPVAVRNILFRAIERTGVRLSLVANRSIRTPASELIDVIQVPVKFDAADSEIVRRLSRGDLVITADVPLAAAAIEKGGHALSPHGERFDEDDIRTRLSLRDFMQSLREGGVDTGGPAPFGEGDKQAFANQLDRFLARRDRER